MKLLILCTSVTAPLPPACLPPFCSGHTSAQLFALWSQVPAPIVSVAWLSTPHAPLVTCDTCSWYLSTHTAARLLVRGKTFQKSFLRGPGCAARVCSPHPTRYTFSIKLPYTWLPLKAEYVAVRSWRRECKQKEIKIVYEALIFNVQPIYVLSACAATCKVAEERWLNRGTHYKDFYNWA